MRFRSMCGFSCLLHMPPTWNLEKVHNESVVLTKLVEQKVATRNTASAVKERSERKGDCEGVKKCTGVGSASVTRPVRLGTVRKQTNKYC